MHYSKLSNLELFIIDVMIHDDIENLLSIVDLLNSDSEFGWRDKWCRDFTKSEVYEALCELEGKDLIYRKIESNGKLVNENNNSRAQIYKNEDWFGLTSQARLIHGKWVMDY